MIETFVAVAEAGSFAAAARRRGLSPPAATRAVAALEERLGVRLVARTTRRLALTGPGAEFLSEARRILAELAAAEAAAAGARTDPSGELRLTAPVLFGERFVMPAVHAALAAHPGLGVTALLVDRVVNLLEEGIDVAVRIAALPDSGMTAVRVGAVRQVAVASPGYLARAGSPGAVRDLAGHATISAGSGLLAQDWRFVAGGRTEAVRIAPRLAVTSVSAAIAAAEAGLGVARLFSYQVAEGLAAGRLVELLPGADDRETPVHLLHAAGRAAPAKLRAFLDLAVPALRAAALRFAARAG